MKTFEPHPFSKAFRKHTEAEILELSEDIKINGQRQRGIIYEGLLLDGNGRQAACIKAGIEFSWKEFEGNQERAINEVKSLNLCRKHLTDDERACAAAEILKLYPKTNQFNAVKNGLHGRMLPKIAKEMNLSQKKVRHAVFIRKHDPEKFEECKNGHLAVGKTARSLYQEINEDKTQQPPTQFSSDLEVSNYAKKLCRENFLTMGIKLERDSFLCKFQDQSITEITFKQSHRGEPTLKQSIVCAIREWIDRNEKANRLRVV